MKTCGQVWTSLSILFICLSGSLCSQEKPVVAEALQQAEKLLGAGDLAACARTLGDYAPSLSAAPPADVAAYLKTRLKLSASQDPYPDLVLQAKALAAKHPPVREADFLNAVANELLNAKNNEAARKILRANVELSPHAPAALFKFLEVFLRTGHGREAFAFYQPIAAREQRENPDFAPWARMILHKLDVQRPYFDRPVPDVLIDVPYAFKIVRQDQSYWIDPPKKRFRSEQTALLQNTAKESTRFVHFALHPQLVVDGIALRDAAGVEIPVKGWTLYTFDQAYSDVFPAFRLETKKDLPAGQTLSFTLKYHLRPEAVLAEPAFWGELTVSPQASYAIFPFGGNNVIFGLNLSTPFTVKIEYPRGYQVCVPGVLAAKEARGDRVVATYSSEKANIPVFCCAPYRKVERRRQDLVLEYYLYPHETFPEELADQLFAALELYRREFGDVGETCFRIATAGPYHFPAGNGENKGNCSFVTDFQLQQALKDPGGRVFYLLVMFHEFFHNWNLFTLRWQGDYGEWFGEGGATFIQAWAAEKILGPEAGRQSRRESAERLARQGGVNCQETLSKVQKKGPVEQSLIYNYGALVWEQCRQKLGDDAFFKGWRDFFRQNGGKPVTWADLLRCWAPYTTVDVAAYLDPWINHNARIALAIQKVETHPRDGAFETVLTLDVDADRDYEIFSELEYQTAAEGESARTIPLHFQKRGVQTVAFVSDRPPRAIRLDPAWRVPRRSLENVSWTAPE